MKISIPILILTITLSGCLSVPGSIEASEETAWQLADQLKGLSDLTLAVGEFDTTEVPNALVDSYRNDLSTTPAITFRETGQDLKVVTRDRVEDVFSEQLMALDGLTYQETRIRIGEILGADVLVAGTMI